MLPPQDHHIIQLPVTPSIKTEALNPFKTAQKWLSALETQLAKDGSKLSEVFNEDSWWRDMLSLDWEFHTIKGLSRIQNFVGQHQPRVQLSNLRLQDGGKAQPAFENPVEGLTWLTSMFFFETSIGRGSGVFYLTQAGEGSDWKAYSVYTCLQELKDVEESVGPRRLEGTLDSMPGGIREGTWIERRQRQIEFADQEPTVLVIGSGKQIQVKRKTSPDILSTCTGQSGLNLGARLQSLNISSLIVDKNERVGDNWRKRYRVSPFLLQCIPPG